MTPIAEMDRYHTPVQDTGKSRFTHASIIFYTIPVNRVVKTGCQNLAIVKFWGFQIFKGDNITIRILRLQP